MALRLDGCRSSKVLIPSAYPELRNYQILPIRILKVWKAVRDILLQMPHVQQNGLVRLVKGGHQFLDGLQGDVWRFDDRNDLLTHFWRGYVL